MSASIAVSNASRPVGRTRAVLWALAGVAGVSMLVVASSLLWKHLNAPALYRYVEQPQAASTPQSRTLQVVSTADEQVLAEVEVATGPEGPVLLSWRARVDDPMLYLPAPRDETQALAAIVAKHRKPGVPVLAWWDTSRQLRHWGGGDMLFDQHLAVPLFVPKAWGAQKGQAARVEQAFWGDAAAADQRKAFEAFAQALVATEDDGVRQLRALVPGGTAVIVLHVRDVLLLGQMFPSALGVAFQDFNDSGDVHRSVRGVRGWLSDESQAAYTVLKQPGNVLRAVALRDEASANTLVARLLPFVGNRQEDVSGLTLVYRSGAYAIFELSAPAAP